MSSCKGIPVHIRATIQESYSYLQDEEVEAIFNIALGDYLRLKYPSRNSMPNMDNLEYDFMMSQWIISRMIDVLGRAGGLSVNSYRENGLSLSYGASYIDPNLVSQIMPQAGIPR